VRVTCVFITTVPMCVISVAHRLPYGRGVHQKTPKLAYQRGPFSERKEFCPGYSTAQQLVYRPVVMAGKSGFLPPVPGRVTGQG
jgi:hypothetical protein